ncbi:MAG: hypothetical protein JRN19_00665 [Nitrososphaerota archaeon]|nr:hypothetical protein [Nitrososphaerota archaeon]MDG7048795.1 hypothetical protein [Nitrososphaerota archaeon]MDG7050961.1 hypothetical protein [Nitrososphaerota archaeon]
MKIAITLNKDNELKPLEEAEILGVISADTKEIIRYQNPGYNISKELTMQAILGLNVDAVVVKEKFLCPGSYGMSFGRLKYVLTQYTNLNDILTNIDILTKHALDELEDSVYAESMNESGACVDDDRPN